MNKKGFTLIELLTVVIIMGILAAMAVPMYEKSMERSRMAEVRSQLATLLEAKLRAMDDRNLATYNNFGVQYLDIGFSCTGGTACQNDKFSTDNFTFTLNPSGSAGDYFRETNITGVSKNMVNAVCATRKTGENTGVSFLYLGELAKNPNQAFLCYNNGVTDGCANYGMASTGSTAWCSN
jgi:prepilin-type N-terminal cleavage/methylation domain-containing protein